MILVSLLRRLPLGCPVVDLVRRLQKPGCLGLLSSPLPQHLPDHEHPLPQRRPRPIRLGELRHVLDDLLPPPQDGGEQLLGGEGKRGLHGLRPDCLCLGPLEEEGQGHDLPGVRRQPLGPLQFLDGPQDAGLDGEVLALLRGTLDAFSREGKVELVDGLARVGVVGEVESVGSTVGQDADGGFGDAELRAVLDEREGLAWGVDREGFRAVEGEGCESRGEFREGEEGEDGGEEGGGREERGEVVGGEGEDGGELGLGESVALSGASGGGGTRWRRGGGRRGDVVFVDDVFLKLFVGFSFASRLLVEN